jgi:flagellar hook protein FlgE
MLRSMFTAVSALNMHQTYLDVIADNLANANTPGFKSTRVIFQSQIAQLMSPEASPTATLGGKNPTQIGMGSQIGSTLTLFTQGMLQATGRNQDVSIQGDGFLIYRAEDGTRYSREGSLTLDAAGYLVNSSTGMRVQGWMTPASGTIDTNAPLTDLQALLDRSIARPTTTATVAGNLNPTDTSATATYNVYDSLGTPQTITMNFAKTAANTWTWTVTAPAGNASTGTVTFGPNGQPLPVNPTGTVSFAPAAPAASPQAVTIDLGGLTMLSTPGASDIAMTYQNGVMAGRVTDITIENNTGMINLQFSNGLSQQLGQIALARFNNATGLIRKGHTSFAPSQNSGAANVGAAATGGRGTITSGYLESSNVDMASEFTNMILAQRGFQAQTRVITTSDEMLQELVNLKR